MALKKTNIQIVTFPSTLPKINLLLLLKIKMQAAVYKGSAA
jgi:hypothetical protein